MDLVKIKIDGINNIDGADDIPEQTCFIEVSEAHQLLSADLKEPILLNGLVKYAQKDGDAYYKRLAITKHVSFTLSRAKSEDVPGYVEE